MTTVTLDDKQLEFLRRETMQQVALDMRHLAEQLEELAIVSPWPVGALHDDALTTRSLVLESLGTLDTLGWPKDEEAAP